MRNLIAIIGLAVLFTACTASKKAGKEKEQLVKITTEYGTMTAKLYNNTPLHRDNFLKLTKEGFYDSLLFHRVIKNFMIQGGDPQSKGAPKGKGLGNGGPGYTIPAEFDSSLIHKKGALAAARLGDNMNPKKESSGSQFYIVQGKIPGDRMLRGVEKSYNFKYTQEQLETYKKVGGTPHLDRNYTVFGELIDGFDVLEKIAQEEGDRMNRPKKDIWMKIEKVK